MTERRAGMAVAVAVALLLSSSFGVASAAGRGRPTKKTLKPGEKPSPKSKFFPLSRTKFGHKRNYEASCADEGGPACYVGCPAECPNSCLVFCEYCLSFCRASSSTSIYII